jgi:hypothetical protein
MMIVKLVFMGLFVHFLPTSAENEPKERRLGRRGVGRMKDYAIHSLSSILSSLRTLLTSPKRVENGYGITRIPAEFAKLQV